MSEDDETRRAADDTASAFNLMANPMASAAAFSALGFGMASQAFGAWMGVVTGVAQASQRMLVPLLDDSVADVESFSAKPKSPATRAKAATKTLIADAKSAAREAADVSARLANDVVKDVQDAAEAVVRQATEIASGVAAELMPEDFRQPKAAAKPETPDDLKTISGVGPKLEVVLNGLGVWTFAQIAEWTREEIAWMDDYLGFKGRIGRDDWIGQATSLASGKGARH